MKKIKILGAVLFSAVIGSGIYAFDTNKDVPIRVKEAFAKKFPNIKKVKWEKESNSEWEGEFKIKGMEYSANFLEDGTWKETEHEIKRNAIPSVYECELEKGELNTEITIDLKGNVISKVTSQE